jgi:hypothetical protein
MGKDCCQIVTISGNLPNMCARFGCNYETMEGIDYCCISCKKGNTHHGPNCKKINCSVLLSPEPEPEPKRLYELGLDTEAITNAIQRGNHTYKLAKMLSHTLLLFLGDSIQKLDIMLVEKIIINVIENYYESDHYVKLMKDICLNHTYTLEDFKTHPQLFQYDTEEEADTFSNFIEKQLGMTTLVVEVPLKEQFLPIVEYIKENGVDDAVRRNVKFFTCGCSDCYIELCKWKEDSDDDYEIFEGYDDVSIGHERDIEYDEDKHFVLIFNEKTPFYYACKHIWFYEALYTGKNGNATFELCQRSNVEEDDFLKITIKERIQSTDLTRDWNIVENMICKPANYMYDRNKKKIDGDGVKYTGVEIDKENEDKNEYYRPASRSNFVTLTFHGHSISW